MTDNKLRVVNSGSPKISGSVLGIHAPHIDRIDDINKSGTLDGITFYQDPCVDNNPRKVDRSPNKLTKQQSLKRSYGSEKSLELSLLDSDSDDDRPEKTREYVEKIIKDTQSFGSVLITTGRMCDRESHNGMIVAKPVIPSGTNIHQTTHRPTIPITPTLVSVVDPVTNHTKKVQTNKKLDTDDTTVDASLIFDSDNINLLYYSQFFELDDKHKKFVLDIKDLISEMCMVLFFHLFLGIHNAIFNVITIDGIMSCIIFYMSYIGVEDKNNFLLKNRLKTLDRYIYYLLLFCGYYLFNYMSWFAFTGFTMYVASIMICPSIMGQIYDIYAYKKIRQVLYDGYNRLVQKIICKQLSKIINIVIKNVLIINIVVGYEDLIPFYNQFSLMIINKFIITFIIACIFNHMDRGSMKFPMMIYKNIYLKDSKYNIADDKSYLRKIISDKQYVKFMDVYTLNRIIRIIVTDDTQKSMLSEQVTQFLQNAMFRFNRVMLCWTIMSIGNLTVGILGFLLFISASDRPLRYLINTLFFTILSFFTVERLLVIILCEICYPIIDSKLLTDVMDDTYQSLKRGFLKLYYRTRLESVILSIGLTYISYHKYNNFGIFAVCVLNLIVLFRIYTSVEFQSGDLFMRHKLIPKLDSNVSRLIQYPVVRSTDDNQGYGTIGLNDSEIRHQESKIIARIPTQTNKKGLTPIYGTGTCTDTIHRTRAIDTDVLTKPPSPIRYIDEIQNNDILLIIRDRIKVVVKNNLLINVINPFKKVGMSSMLRIFTHLFMLLMFGYISDFSTLHILFLPIMVQNVIDIIV
jgi:hypothetical protein